MLTHVPAALDEVNHLKQSRKDKDAQAAKAREQVCSFLASPQCGLFAGRGRVLLYFCGERGKEGSARVCGCGVAAEHEHQ